jgi:ribosomal protein L7/L12
MSTTGKIFQESNNIYQDEAKVLYSYYHQAAERIVREEERIEKEIMALESEKKNIEAQKSTCWKWFLTIVLFFVYWIRKNKYDKQIIALNTRIDDFKKQHKEIFRDYKVNKLGIAYVPIADQIKYEDKSFIVDYTGQVSKAQMTLQMSRQNDLLCSTIEDIKKLNTEAPIVETSNEAEAVETDEYSLSMQEIYQNDYLGKLDRSLRTISYCMNDLDTSSVSLPLVSDNSQQLENINEYATSQLPKNATIVPIFNSDQYKEDIAKFEELNKLKDSLSNESEQFEKVLKDLMQTMASSVQTISMLKLSSTDKLVNESNNLLYKILKAPYNHYSPILEAEEIQRIRDEKFDYTESVQGYQPFTLRQSSRVRYNLVTDTWTAEDGSTTTMPFGVHQIYEEIVAPMVEKLMQENRIERLKIYNQIKDQKISYLNKWHQDTDAFYRSNRAQSADLINLMQETLSQYVAAYNTLISLQKTQDSMNNSKDLESGIVNIEDNSTETLLAFETQAKEFEQVQTDFEEYMDRLKEDIDNRADEFSHIEYYDARLQDGHSNELAIATGEARNMDDRRKALTAVNPLLAKKSELPPTPQIEDIVYEHLSLNLPMIAKNALDELAEKNKKIEQINNSEVFNTNEINDENLKETEKIKDIEENNTEETYTVLLNNPGENKLALVKVIKENLGLSLAESKDIVDEAPTTITNGLNKDDAEELADSLRSVGADIEVYSSKQEPNE